MRFEANADIPLYIEKAKELRDCGCNLFTVPDNPGANIGIDSITTAALLQRETGVPTVFHKSAAHMNLISLYSSLLGAWVSNLQGILAVSGDPPATGFFSRMASRITDIKSSVEFLKMISMLEEGTCVNYQQLKTPRSFFRICSFAPQRNFKSQLDWLQRKIDAGAEAAFTQPFFTIDSYNETQELLADKVDNIKITNGIFPVLSVKQAHILASGRIPGIVIPKNYIEDISKYEQTVDQQKYGIEQATKTAKYIYNQKGLIYLILPFAKTRFETIKEIIRDIKS